VNLNLTRPFSSSTRSGRPPSRTPLHSTRVCASLLWVTRCVVLDIGGVLEFTPATNWLSQWESEAQLAPGTASKVLDNIFLAGAVGNLTEAEILAAAKANLQVCDALLDRFWAEFWHGYLLQVEPQDIVFVDDTPAMVNGARAAGWHAVLFRGTTQAIAEVTSVLDS
jgi:hypothetical protein